MKAIEPSLVKDNFYRDIGKEWMLVSAGDKDKFNMMTASWGGVGFLWNKAGSVRLYPSGTLYPRVCRCEGSFHAVLFRRRA